MTSVLVLHAVGDADGGAVWCEAFQTAGFTEVLAPDLPGHRSTGSPVGANYTLTDAACVCARLLADGLDVSDWLIVGVGQSGWSAQLMAMSGYGSALVLVDGLGAPWMESKDRVQRRRARNRAVMADQQALDHYVGGGLDPRLSHGMASHGDYEMALRAARCTPVPTLVIETTPQADEQLVGAFQTGCELSVRQNTPQAVAESIQEWTRRRPGR